MPRIGPYKAWSSNNVAKLEKFKENDLHGQIDWRDPERPATLREIPAWDDARWEGHEGDGPPRNLIAGRAHREEAILTQLKGVEQQEGCNNKCKDDDGIFESCRATSHFRGACGNCIWQSKAMECSHALDVLEAELDEKKRRAAAKDGLLELKSALNSSKRTKRVKAVRAAAGGAGGAAAADDGGEDEEAAPPQPVVTQRKSPKKRGAGKVAGPAAAPARSSRRKK